MSDAPEAPQHVAIRLKNPFALGFAATAGGLVAFALGGAVSSLSTVLLSIGIALFIAMALEPAVSWLERDRLSRPWAIAAVFLTFALLTVAVLAILIPVTALQVSKFAAGFPDYLASIQGSGWFRTLAEWSGQGAMYEEMIEQARSWLSDPENLLTLSGGALAVGTGVINGFSAALIVLVLTLYFLASMTTIKGAITRLTPAYARPRVSRVADELTRSVGAYVSGMGVIAFINAVFTLVLLLVLRVPFAPLLAVLAFLLAMIPNVGTMVFWVLGSLVSLLTVGWVGLVFVIGYFAYVQFESYVLSGRITGRAVPVPGALTVIGAMVGGTLLGLLGAVVAVPVTASVLMIINEVFIPRQDARTDPDE